MKSGLDAEGGDQWKGQTLKKVPLTVPWSSVSPMSLVYLPKATLEAPGCSATAWPMAAIPVATMDRVSIPMTSIAASFGFIIATLLRLRFACHETRD